MHDIPTKKMRIEIFNDGDRYTITFEGNVTRDKALRLLDLVELLGGIPVTNGESDYSTSHTSKIEKVRLIAEKNFPLTWFTSSELQAEYEKQFNQPLSLSTASTYLSRLADRGYFIKRRVSNKLRYRIIATGPDYKIRQR